MKHARALACAVALALFVAACAQSRSQIEPGDVASSDPIRTTTTIEREGERSPSPTFARVDDKELGVAWINEGSIGDDAWTDAHHAGMLAVEDRFGPAVKTTFVEQVGHGPDPTRVIDDLVASGYDLIFATSFPLSDAVIDAARRYPQVRFGQARGRKGLPNLTTYSGADEEPIYLAGMAAAGTSHDGVIGFIGAVPEAETIRHVDAFALGARAVRPDVRILLRWTGAWFAPEREAALGRSLVRAGADVLATGSVSTVIGDLADRLGIGWVGHDADHSSDYPESWITGAVPRWDRYYVDQVAKALNGTWESEDYYGTMADGFTTLAHIGRIVPSNTRQQVLQASQELEDGHRDIFAGPIRGQDGRLRVPAGRTLTLEERRRLGWLVDGVEGDVRGP